jgi:hypothetical protein
LSAAIDRRTSQRAVGASATAVHERRRSSVLCSGGQQRVRIPASTDRSPRDRASASSPCRDRRSGLFSQNVAYPDAPPTARCASLSRPGNAGKDWNRVRDRDTRLEAIAGLAPARRLGPAPRHERGSRHGAPHGCSSQSCIGRRTRLLAPPEGRSRLSFVRKRASAGQEAHFSFHEAGAVSGTAIATLETSALGQKQRRCSSCGGVVTHLFDAPLVFGGLLV